MKISRFADLKFDFFNVAIIFLLLHNADYQINSLSGSGLSNLIDGRV